MGGLRQAQCRSEDRTAFFLKIRPKTSGMGRFTVHEARADRNSGKERRRRTAIKIGLGRVLGARRASFEFENDDRALGQDEAIDRPVHGPSTHVVRSGQAGRVEIERERHFVQRSARLIERTNFCVRHERPIAARRACVQRRFVAEVERLCPVQRRDAIDDPFVADIVTQSFALEQPMHERSDLPTGRGDSDR